MFIFSFALLGLDPPAAGGTGGAGGTAAPALAAAAPALAAAAPALAAVLASVAAFWTALGVAFAGYCTRYWAAVSAFACAT